MKISAYLNPKILTYLDFFEKGWYEIDKNTLYVVTIEPSLDSGYSFITIEFNKYFSISLLLPNSDVPKMICEKNDKITKILYFSQD